MHFLCIVCINMPPHFCAAKLVSHTLLTLREGRALIVWLELGENNYSDSQDAFSDTQSRASKRFPLFHIPTKQSHRFAWCMVVFFPPSVLPGASCCCPCSLFSSLCPRGLWCLCHELFTGNMCCVWPCNSVPFRKSSSSPFSSGSRAGCQQLLTSHAPATSAV